MRLMYSMNMAPKAKTSPKAKPQHPKFHNMIVEAIATLKERGGSSPHAIKKVMMEKHKNLPANADKIVMMTIKRMVASGCLIKVKASYKLSPKELKAVKPAKKQVKTATSKKATKAVAA